MFKIFKKSRKAMSDPEASIDQADKALNKGLTGILTKAFMGKEFVAQSNQALRIAKESLDHARLRQELSETGKDATGKVLEITDTGRLINYDPVVSMKLLVTPGRGRDFEYTMTTVASKIAVPRAGETVNLKIHPQDPSQIVYTGIRQA